MSRSRLTRGVAVVAVGASLLWGGSRLRGQTSAPSQGAAPQRSSPAGTAPLVGVGADAGALSFLPGDSSGASGAVVPGAAGVDGEAVAAIPLPPSAYPGMVGLATAALGVWRYRRRFGR